MRPSSAAAVVAILAALSVPAVAEARTTILCNQGSYDSRVDVAHPRRCYTLGPGQANYQAVNLVNLRWSGWGHSRATARGQITRSMGYGPIAVRVVAFRRRATCGEDHRYLRLRVTTSVGRSVLKFPAGCDAA